MTAKLGKTKPQPMITKEELREIYKERLEGNEEIANKMTKKLQQEQINKWANRLNSMSSSEQQKYISNNSKRFKRPDADLDCSKTEEYKEEWRSKWNAVDGVDRADIIGKLPNFIGEIPEYATVDFLQTILNKLPNHKALGPS